MRADAETHRDLRERVVGIVLVGVLVDLLCTVLVLLFERHPSGTDVASPAGSFGAFFHRRSHDRAAHERRGR